MRKATLSAVGIVAGSQLAQRKQARQRIALSSGQHYPVSGTKRAWLSLYFYYSTHERREDH